MFPNYSAPAVESGLFSAVDVALPDSPFPRLWREHPLSTNELRSAIRSVDAAAAFAADRRGRPRGPAGRRADGGGFECLARQDSVRSLYLHRYCVERLDSIVVWPALQELTLRQVRIGDQDTPETMRAFAEELRKLPTRAKLEACKFDLLSWKDLEDDRTPDDARRVSRCLEVLRTAEHVDLEIPDRNGEIASWLEEMARAENE
ncbi:hypothetical protein DFJ74DRAFT_701079 [Hyaloraphidium curvatum]|nr:hypothetical protein DFJ74DRAFT_701079 [Hyaloraphidium curvatum]